MGKRRVNFQRCWLPVSRIGLHRRGVERVNCGPKLLEGIGRINTPVIFPIYNKKQAISNRQVIINPLAVPLLSTNQ